MVLSSAIVCDRDRRIAEVCFHMIADDRRPYCDLRSAIIWKPAFKVRYGELRLDFNVNNVLLLRKNQFQTFLTEEKIS